MTSAPLEQLAHALDGTGRLVAGVSAEQWSAPTPCAEWTVRDLVGHVVGGNRLFAEIVQGAVEDPSRSLGTDELGDDPVAAYRESADALLAAFGLPGALERVVTVPLGAVPGIAALHLRVVEALVHGWDLAQATGQSLPFSDDLAEQELKFSQGKLADIPPGRRPFGPPQPAADDAPAIDRLAACLGRRVA